MRRTAQCDCRFFASPYGRVVHTTLWEFPLKAVVWHGVGDIRLDDVPAPRIEEVTDAVVELTASAICGTDLHLIRGTMPGMKDGTILGHEGVGIVKDLGSDVRGFDVGDRVVVLSTIACGYCEFCRAGYYAKCDNANPNGPGHGTAFFGGPEEAGAIDGMQAEEVRVPFASTTLVKLPGKVSDDQAILISDIFCTGYFGADMARIEPGKSVAVFGCGPVGQFAIASAKLMDAGRVFGIDAIPSRLDMARKQGAEVINFDEEDPVETIMRLTGNIGPDSVIDAVGVDAYRPMHGPAAAKSKKEEKVFKRELEQVAPNANPRGDNWHPGNAPSQVLEWAVDCLSKAGTLSIIGVYPAAMTVFPIGKAMSKNLTINTGDCNHRRYGPKLVNLVATGMFDPTSIEMRREKLSSAIEAYEAFDKREEGWTKVELAPAE
jgi:threonine dehydrogenase-like Zn-dependent dehydrogenase